MQTTEILKQIENALWKWEDKWDDILDGFIICAAKALIYLMFLFDVSSFRRGALILSQTSIYNLLCSLFLFGIKL